ncbi:hypothetical protein AUJ61_00275 [Candidatus Pacearchaeota archaeon CG1_02_30_18]|nr:MAG: hypothetical protein AUJ61_00275 [Candidatus Pacearchaeota archaeon CG1_02_30_18]PIN71422.1 MAG: hypothetical protein COV77_02045 [Candidatus Pacearchaeota archaeon CG11_big_fil_rev_8_21_14_0_20_30_13]
MLTKKEFFSIIIVTLLLGVIISLLESLNLFLVTFLIIFLIIFINIAAKKILAFYLDTDIETKIWEVKQFGYQKHLHFKENIQAGIFTPLIIKFLSVGLINWMACLTFEASGKTYRAARRHGIYSFSEVTEEEMGWIAGAGIIATLIFAVIGYVIGQETFAKLSIMYAFYNMLPLFDFDGAKIFFGNITFWSFLAIITLIGVFATILII